MMSGLSVDDKHVFSEFDDPERQVLIRHIAEQIPSLCEIPRGNFFFLWFSDIEVLRKRASLHDDSDIDSLAVFLKRLPISGIAGVCKYTQVFAQKRILTISAQTRGFDKSRAATLSDSAGYCRWTFQTCGSGVGARHCKLHECCMLFKIHSIERIRR
jgi:hypothetical protein